MITLFKRWCWLFEVPKWSQEQEEDAETVLSIFDILTEYIDEIQDKLTDYKYNGDAAMVHLKNPVHMGSEILKLL